MKLSDYVKEMSDISKARRKLNERERIANKKYIVSHAKCLVGDIFKIKGTEVIISDIKVAVNGDLSYEYRVIRRNGEFGKVERSTLDFTIFEK